MDCCNICLIVLLFFDVIVGIELHGPNVCMKDVSGVNVTYCCFNHFPNNGTCRECENGTVSHEGAPCKRCLSNFYGHKCKFECRCQNKDRCDPKFGCVDSSIIITAEDKVTTKIDSETKSTITEQYIPADLETRPTITEHYIPADSETRSLITEQYIPAGKHADLETRPTISEHYILADSETKQTITEHYISAGSQTPYFYYMIAGVILLVFCILCVSFIKCLYNRNFHVQTQQQHRSLKRLTEALSRLPLPPIPRKSHHIYDTIDDIVASNIQHMSTHNRDIELEPCNLSNSLTRSVESQITIRTNSGSTDSTSLNESDELNYLNPYNALKEVSKRETVLHKYDDCRKVFNQSEDRIINEQDKIHSVIWCRSNDEQDYLNPYTSLKDKDKRQTMIHEYVTFCCNTYQLRTKKISNMRTGERMSMPICSNCSFLIFEHQNIPVRRKYPTF